MKNIYEKYKHIIPFALYFLVYMTWFSWLEQRHIWQYQIIHLAIDDYIPFNEIFVIPYFLWFVYVPGVVLYLAFHNKDDYYRSAIFLCTGMTVFLLVSTFFPNGQRLRPLVMPRDNIFTQMVASLYRTDTPTNLWPSIHVYNSLGSPHCPVPFPGRQKEMGARFLRYPVCFHNSGYRIHQTAFRIRYADSLRYGSCHVRHCLPLRCPYLSQTAPHCQKGRQNRPQRSQIT